ncbi:MAG: KEOPS complex N(6)-L-threonylcarbamoyladenine synthase Kae1 [Candidatus Nezhaarchaeales archaeon]
MKVPHRGLSEMVKVLGIECTAHTYGVGIVTDRGEILANVNDTYVPLKGGIHPRDSAQHHSLVAVKVLKQALAEAKSSLEDIDAIAASFGPGFGPCLRTGCTVARVLALSLGKPLIRVNHCIAHVEIGRLLTGARDPLTVYVSGGNTMITAYAEGRYRVFGETLDIALGNFLDVLARELGLPHPGGPIIEKLAEKGKHLLPLPYVVKGQDVSYSGLLTAAKRRFKERGSIEDVCYSSQEVAFDMLVEVAERALAHTEKKELLLTGGVAANKRLQEKLSIIAKEHDALFLVVPKQYAGDNGAMIAWTGALAHKFCMSDNIEESFVQPRWRIDEVEVPWRKV